MATQVKSEIAGVVEQVLVENGETVASEAELVLLGSMKMEIPVLAPRPGRVVEVLVEPGDAITEGAVLVILE